MRCANMTQVDPGTKNSGRKHSRGPSKHPRTQAPPPSLSLVLTGFGIERLGACERGGGEGGGARARTCTGGAELWCHKFPGTGTRALSPPVNIARGKAVYGNRLNLPTLLLYLLRIYSFFRPTCDRLKRYRARARAPIWACCPDSADPPPNSIKSRLRLRLWPYSIAWLARRGQS